MWWWLIPVSAITVIFAVVIIRTLMFKPKATDFGEPTPETFDEEKAVQDLCKLVSCKTVSYEDKSLEDDKEFKKLIGLLPTFYPNVYKTCSLIELPDRALLFKWSGKTDNDPAVMMAHYDVVPVNAEAWETDPFEPVIKDGAIFGRGTIDTKATFCGILFAAEKLIAEGFMPESTVYFAFSGGEEVNGKGAVNIVDYFQQNSITPSFVLDEGGAVVENVFPGVKGACALVGIAEKGLMNVEYSCLSNGGHASAPKPKTPIDTLAKACINLVKNPFKSHLSAPVAKMFDTLGRHSTFVYRMIFANLWLFFPILDMICKASGGDLNALMRTTVAFTQMNGSSAPNVIPPKASIISNMRLNPLDTTDSALEYLKKTVNDPAVQINLLIGNNPSRISTTDCEGWEKIKKSIVATWEGSIVSPYLMVQCSDSRHYGKISDKVFRFSAMDLTNEERATIHGNNERVRIDTFKRTVLFYIRLMKSC